MTPERKVATPNEEVRVLRILKEGCRRHPAYRARRGPGVAGCAVCDAMYDAARALASLDAAKAERRA